MSLIFFCSAIDGNKVVELRTFSTEHEVNIYAAESKLKGWQVECRRYTLPTKPKPKHEVQYVPPPKWGGRVVCIETGYIYTSIAAAAKCMQGSQWALRKAVIRNTIYHHFHWRMYGDIEKKIDKFT